MLTKRAIILKFFGWTLLLAAIVFVTGCQDDSGSGASSEDYVDLLTNQVDNVIIPTMENYKEQMTVLTSSVDAFVESPNATTLDAARSSYRVAYAAYQIAAVHNYFATANQSLVETTNLYPVDTALLADLIANASYNFNTSAQMRANGFPAIDYMLFGPSDVIEYFDNNVKRKDFFKALTQAMKSKAETLASSWSTGSLRTNFIENGGVQLGSSISVQLNESLVYYEDHVRENKVGIPIGRLGPNDSPIPADATKREAYYAAQFDGHDSFPLELVRETVRAMERMYLGQTFAGNDGQGYDDILIARDKQSLNADIKAMYTAIYTTIDSRSSIAGDEELYNKIQSLVTIYKSDLLPVLNVQDADGANDGD